MRTIFRRIGLLLLSLFGILMLPGAAMAEDGQNLGDAAHWANSHLGVVDTQGKLSLKVANQLQGVTSQLLTQYGVRLTVFMEPAPDEPPVLTPREAWIYLEDNSVTVYTGAYLRRALEPLNLEEFQKKWMMLGHGKAADSNSLTDWRAQNLLAGVQGLLAQRYGEEVPEKLVLRRYLFDDGKPVGTQDMAVSEFWKEQQRLRLSAWAVCLGILVIIGIFVTRKPPEGTVPGDGSNFKDGIGSGVMGLTTTQSTSGYTSGTGGLSYSPK